MNDYWRSLGPIQYEFQQSTDIPFLVKIRPDTFGTGKHCSAYCDVQEGNLSDLSKAMAGDKVKLSQMLIQRKYKVNQSYKAEH